MDGNSNENNDEEDIMDFLESKGSILDAFKHEYLELMKMNEILSASNIGKERDNEYQTAELKMQREQLAFTRRNVEELISQQEVLKETIDNITHKKDSLIQNEQHDRSEISKFSNVFVELRDLLSVGADWSTDQLEMKAALEKERDFISSKLDNKSSQLQGLRHDIEHTYEYIKKLEDENAVLDEQIDDIEKKRTDIKKNATNLHHRKDEIEKKIFNMRNEIVEIENNILEKNKSHKAEERALKVLDSSIMKSKSKMESYIEEYEKILKTITETTNELERQNYTNEKLQIEIEEKSKYIETKEIELKKITAEVKKTRSLCQLATEKCQQIDELKHQAENKLENYQKQMATIRELDMVATRKDIESLDKQSSNAKAELDIVRKKTVTSERTSKAMLDLIQLNKNGKINLLLEKRILEEEVVQQKVQIRSLLLEKERYEHDAEVASQQYYTALEEMKLQELQVQELNKKISVDSAKLKQKQSLFESVRSDRNLYSKQLIDSQDEINELKRKFRSMNHQIDQMKEEISMKDHSIVKEHFLHHSVDKERELLKNELTKIRKQVHSSEVIIDNQRVEIMKLQRIIEEADQESQRQKNELGAVLSERNLLTAQLVKRNFELGEMYEKIKVQRSNLRIGERNYNKYIESLSSWQKSLITLVRDHNDIVQGLSKIDEVRKHVIKLEKEILTEQTKSSALSDELEVPMNVHRWRILESSDPKRYEKILLIQNLQKILIKMSDDIIRLELLIQEKEKIYIELKNVISRQPGPEVEEQILLYAQTLKEKNKQCIAMNNELDMYMEQVKVFREEISDIDSDISKINKKWMKMVKKNAQDKLVSTIDVDEYAGFTSPSMVLPISSTTIYFEQEISSRKTITNAVSRHFAKWKNRYFCVLIGTCNLRIQSKDRKTQTIISLKDSFTEVQHHYYDDIPNCLSIKYRDKSNQLHSEILIKFDTTETFNEWHQGLLMLKLEYSLQTNYAALAQLHPLRDYLYKIYESLTLNQQDKNKVLDSSGEQPIIDSSHFLSHEQAVFDMSFENEPIIAPPVQKKHDNIFKGIPIPKLTIVIMAVGTRGDIQPFTLLALRLIADGHHVRLATHKCYREYVMSHKIEFFPLAGDPVKLSEFMVKTQGSVMNFSSELLLEIPKYHAMIVDILNSTWDACISPSDPSSRSFVADAIISNPVTYGHIHCAEALGIPLHMMFPQPWVPTKAFAHPMARYNNGYGWSKENYLSYQVVDRIMWMGFEREINNFRLKLKLDPIRTGENGWNLINSLNVPYALLFSSTLVKKPKDWPDHVDIVGSLIPPEVTKLENFDNNVKIKVPIDYSPSPELINFLSTSIPIVFVGFGSMVMTAIEMRSLISWFLEAAAIANVKILVQMGWSEISLEEFQKIALEVESKAKALQEMEEMNLGNSVIFPSSQSSEKFVHKEGSILANARVVKESSHGSWIDRYQETVKVTSDLIRTGTSNLYKSIAEKPTANTTNTITPDNEDWLDDVQFAPWSANKDAFFLGPCPHAWLFQYMSGVVHHGGAGTTAAGLNCGCPTWITPVFGDQYFWGEIVYNAGLGPKPIEIYELLKHADPDTNNGVNPVHIIVNALQTLVNRNVKKKAVAIAENMNNENGIEEALNSFYKHLPVENMICDVSIFNGVSKVAQVFCKVCGFKMCMEVAREIHSNPSKENHIDHIIPCTFVNWSRRSPLNPTDGVVQGLGGLIYEMTSGMTDAIYDPIKGMYDQGLYGGAAGLKTGVNRLISKQITGGHVLVNKVLEGFKTVYSNKSDVDVASSPLYADSKNNNKTNQFLRTNDNKSLNIKSLRTKSINLNNTNDSFISQSQKSTESAADRIFKLVANNNNNNNNKNDNNNKINMKQYENDVAFGNDYSNSENNDGLFFTDELSAVTPTSMMNSDDEINQKINNDYNNINDNIDNDMFLKDMTNGLCDDDINHEINIIRDNNTNDNHDIIDLENNYDIPAFLTNYNNEEDENIR
eukprot:gene11029-14810_t